MSQGEKAALYRELKQAGVQFDRHYREYTTDELRDGVAALRKKQRAARPAPESEPLPAPDETDQPMFEIPAEPPPQPERPSITLPDIPVRGRDANELPGQRLNKGLGSMAPIRTDPETGFVWYQEEVRKPAYPKPRGRRVLDYVDTGTKTETVHTGQFQESFEVAGEGLRKAAQVKITLPSYQVGIYKDPRFPFKIHVYNDNRGFDLHEVQDFYGGSELVPSEVKRIYVENHLCYDIRTTVRAIMSEHRQNQLTRGARA